MKQLMTGTAIYRNVNGVEAVDVQTEEDVNSLDPSGNFRAMLDLSSIRQRLEQDLEERVTRVEKIDNRLRQPGDVDWEEQATQRENDEVLEALGSQAVKEIDQIKQAIHRIDDGTYGVCSRCGKAIMPQRLEVLPYATSCMQCA